MSARCFFARHSWKRTQQMYVPPEPSRNMLGLSMMADQCQRCGAIRNVHTYTTGRHSSSAAVSSGGGDK